MDYLFRRYFTPTGFVRLMGFWFLPIFSPYRTFNSSVRSGMLVEMNKPGKAKPRMGDINL
jgi:hypothetical protein